MDKPLVVIDAYNPYEARFPNRTVISREELHLIKLLRTNGIDYKVRSKYSGKLYILSQKNFENLLSDPILLTIYNLAVGVGASYVYKALNGKKDLNNKLFIKNKDGEVFNYQGDSLDRDTIKHVTDAMFKTQSDFAKTKALKSPYPELPHPVHLEHTAKVVGWCNLVVDERGLRADPVKVTCDDTWKRIQEKDLQGLSIGSLVSKCRCSICGDSYIDCNHITGNQYNEQNCFCEIQSFDIAEVSIVCNPANNLCGITLSK
ncbi:HK97 family phage prohead protease [Vibrio cholerae]|nr:HK97 family phage prohead protease [Vibrio cholerae]